jgi:hypothetical protein
MLGRNSSLKGVHNDNVTVNWSSSRAGDVTAHAATSTDPATRPPADHLNVRRRISPAVVKALFLEKNISEQCATGNGGLIALAADPAPLGIFRARDLGLGWREAPSILTVQETLAVDNVDRKKKLFSDEKNRITMLLASAKKEHLRTRIKQPEAPTGCAGCSSCVSAMRTRPRRARAETRRRQWLPGFEHAIAAGVANFIAGPWLQAEAIAAGVAKFVAGPWRQARAVAAGIAKFIAAPWRQERVRRSDTASTRRDTAGAAKPRRRGGARAEISSRRRSEHKLMRAAAARALGGELPPEEAAS